MQPTAFNRKALLSAFEVAPGQWRPALVLACDLALFLVGTALVLYAGHLSLKILGTAIVTAAIVRLFLIGHEACHGSFFRSARANAILGRLAFLPSLTAYSLWEVGHNVAHHGFNNLKGRDQVWAPFSKAEFDALPPRRQALERLYRSGFGWGAYYLLEMWWKKLYFASRREIGASRRRYHLDSLLVTVAAALWVGLVAWVARDTGQSVALLVTLAAVIPFLLWNGIIGFVVFLHHTSPRIAWFANRHEWQRARAYMTATAGVRFPFGLDRALHDIMEHHAHHLNPRISMFQLRSAQQNLRHRYPELCAYRLDRVAYRDLVRQCKLYDFQNHAWLDFSGRVTARIGLPSNAAAIG
jgi:omega-6 fatty acid desaturase (delta-12 desaturase)